MNEIKQEPVFVVFRTSMEVFGDILRHHPEAPLQFAPVVHREDFTPNPEMIPLVMTMDKELLALGGVVEYQDRGEVWVWIIYKHRAKAALRAFVESSRRALLSLRMSLCKPLRCICIESKSRRNLKFAKAVGFIETGRKVFAGEDKIPCLELEIA